jgi:hypothetical protein
MGKWLVLLVTGVLAAARAQSAARETPPLELALHQVDAVDLFHMLAQLEGSPMLIVRPAVDVRLDFPEQKISPAVLLAKLGERAQLRATRTGEVDIWMPACAAPVPRAVSLPKDERMTLSFDDVHSETVLRILAEVEGLVIDAPEGIPDTRLAVSLINRRTTELASALATALDVELKVVGDELQVVRPRNSATCGGARNRWIKLDAAWREAAKPLSEAAPCGRLQKFPASIDFRCQWYESQPLADFRMRGFVAMSERSPKMAYIEAPKGPPMLAMPGDRFSDEFVSVSDVGREAVFLGQFEPAVPEPATVRAFAVRYADGELNDFTPSLVEKPTLFERNFYERYALEDLLVESTRKEGERWIADVRSIHGMTNPLQVGSYIGPDMGRIVSIDADGLQVMRIRRDRTGAYYEEAVRLITGAWYEQPRDILRRRLTQPEIHSELQKDFVQAAAQGDFESLARLYAQGANIDARYDECNALFAAVDYRKTGNPQMVRWLLARGAHSDGLFSELETTPLTRAVQTENLEVVRLLLDAGADRNLADADEYSPLHHAASLGLTDIARILVSKGANTRAIDDTGRTPAMLAAYYGNKEVLKALLRAGLRVGDADRYGNTLLGAAAEGGQLETARYLIGRGADVNAQDRWHNSILDRARRYGRNKALESLLVSKGARPGAPPIRGSN